jgi:hypothetical protein
MPFQNADYADTVSHSLRSAAVRLHERSLRVGGRS